MNKVRVVGIGPGSAEHITPAAVNALRECDLIFGGTRNLAILNSLPELIGTDCEQFDFTGRLDEAKDKILSDMTVRTVGVAASGDAGFYGILRYLRRFLSADELIVVPGISSLQYFCARLAVCWDDINTASIHGRNDDIIECVARGRAAILTDARESISSIASRIADAGYGERMMHVGCNLSYSDEKIISGCVASFVGKDVDAALCVVVIDVE